jgi:hypothetical protein
MRLLANPASVAIVVASLGACEASGPTGVPTKSSAVPPAVSGSNGGSPTASSAVPRASASASAEWLADPRVINGVHFMDVLRNSIAADDHNASASMFQFPLKVATLSGGERKGAWINVDLATFLRHYNDIITPCIRELIAGATDEDLNVREFDSFIGVGEVCFKPVDVKDPPTYRVFMVDNSPSTCAARRQHQPRWRK